jgi:hypothetical protein
MVLLSTDLLVSTVDTLLLEQFFWQLLFIVELVTTILFLPTSGTNVQHGIGTLSTLFESSFSSLFIHEERVFKLVYSRTVFRRAGYFWFV